jgi:SAM-dependent methyltransferase
MFYQRQVERVEGTMKPGSIVLDVGCGPALPYRHAGDVLLIGVDASYESIRANTTVDLLIYASTDVLPLPARSVDLILCIPSTT